MDLDRDKQLKFANDTTSEPIVIEKAGVEELQFGKKFVVNITPTILGHDHFLPSEGLLKKLKEQNADIGDTITIEKVGPSDKYQYGYFNVSVLKKSKQGNPQVDKVEKAEPVTNNTKTNSADQQMELHEVTLRLEKVEKLCEILWKDYGMRTSDAGHKQGDEQIPF